MITFGEYCNEWVIEDGIVRATYNDLLYSSRDGTLTKKEVSSCLLLEDNKTVTYHTYSRHPQ